VFLGRYRHTIDTKGRLSIPGKYRDVLAQRYGDVLVVTKDSDLCLVIHPMEEWKQLAEKIKAIPGAVQAVKDYKRFVHGEAVDCTLDRQGRILIPPELREFAGLGRDVVLVGVNDHIEVWSLERWQTKSEQMARELDHITRVIAGYGV
jgi:MraZ protein